jgi:citrate lyase subunit beta/citryl-CoA lyase
MPSTPLGTLIMLLIRIHTLMLRRGHHDVSAIATSGAHAIVIPKVSSPKDILQVHDLLEASNAPNTLHIWAMIETPLGILRASEICRAHPRLSCLVFGSSDLTKCLGSAHTRDRHALQTSLGLVVLAARAHDLCVLDGVHLDLSDAEGFEATCLQGREMGFDGRTLIHPKTIEMANRTYAPSEDEIELSRRVIAAHSRALERGEGVTLLDGQLVENLHVETAERLLRRHERIIQN